LRCSDWGQFEEYWQRSCIGLLKEEGMKRLLCLLAMAMLSDCGSPDTSSKSLNVFGNDQRVITSTSTIPGKMLGRLDGGCTAVMVGDRYALTAAHCVYDSNTQTLRTDVKNLNVGVQEDHAPHNAWIKKVWIGTNQPVKQRKWDWAILYLNENIGEKTGWMGVQSLKIEEKLPFAINLAGYSTDKESGSHPYLQTDCYIFEKDHDGRMLHDCDTSTGSSGSPLYEQSEDGPIVVALTVAEFRSGDTSMTRSRYTSKFANIAVSASHFQSILGKLRANGDRYPLSSKNVKVFANTNASTNHSNEKISLARDIDTPPNRKKTVNKNQYSAVYTNRYQINQKAIFIGHEAQKIRNYSSSRGLTDFSYRSNQVVLKAKGIVFYSSEQNLSGDSLDKNVTSILRIFPELRDTVFELTRYYRSYFPPYSLIDQEIGHRVRCLESYLVDLTALIQQRNE